MHDSTYSYNKLVDATQLIRLKAYSALITQIMN